MNVRPLFRKALLILFWLIIWEVLARTVGNSILLVGPLEVLGTLIRKLPELEFWKTILYSLGKIGMGFALAFLSGILLGALGFRFPLFRELIAPIVSLLKSVPVASFVILALIWIGSENLAVAISFMVVFPILYLNTLAGLRSTDRELLEMAQVFSIPFFRKVRFLYLPALMPYLISGCQIALGMSWKSGVAAEVIGTPAHSVGKQLYLSKTWLDTGNLFCWTLVIILVSSAFEHLILSLLKRIPQGSSYKEEAL